MILESRDSLLNHRLLTRANLMLLPTYVENAQLELQKSQEQLEVHENSLRMFREDPETIEQSLMELVQRAKQKVDHQRALLEMHELTKAACITQLADIERWLAEHPE